MARRFKGGRELTRYGKFGKSVGSPPLKMISEMPWVEWKKSDQSESWRCLNEKS